jgi:Chaperone of endosialidase
MKLGAFGWRVMKYNCLIGLFLTTALAGCVTTQVPLDPYEPGDGYVYQDVVFVDPGEGEAFTIKKVNTYRVKKGQSAGAIACAENFHASNTFDSAGDDKLLSAAEKAGIPEALKRRKRLLEQQGGAQGAADCLPGSEIVAGGKGAGASTTAAASTTAEASTTVIVTTTPAASTTPSVSTTAAPTTTVTVSTTAAPTTPPPTSTAPPTSTSAPTTPAPLPTEGPIAVSDIRLKRDIAEVGKLANGLTLYRFRYLRGDDEFVGVMAQDVLEVIPGAVITAPDGFYRVRYELVGFKMCLYSDWPAHAACTGSAIAAA